MVSAHICSIKVNALKLMTSPDLILKKKGGRNGIGRSLRFLLLLAIETIVLKCDAASGEDSFGPLDVAHSTRNGIPFIYYSHLSIMCSDYLRSQQDRCYVGMYAIAYLHTQLVLTATTRINNTYTIERCQYHW